MNLNSACDCCNEPPATLVDIEYTSVHQDCVPSNCGETPCTSTDAVYDEDGNCLAPAQVCSPNWEDLTEAEKCAAKRYLKITTVDRSGGETHGRTQVKQYTAGDEGACSSETTCSGSSTTTVESESEYTSSGSSVTCTSSLNTTETTVRTFNSDCTYEDVTTCSGTSSFDVEAGNCMDFGCEATYNADCTWDGSDYYEGPNQTGSGCETVTFPFSGAEEGCGQCDGATIESTTEVSPEPDCSITVTYSEENSQGSCTPSSFPAFPAFVDCVPDGEPEYPQLESGQAYLDEAFQFKNPNNPSIKSIQKIKFRISHQPSASCYLKVWMRKVIQAYKFEDCDTGFSGDEPRTPQLNMDCEAQPCYTRWSTSGPVTYEELNPYVWRGSGNPCFADTTKLFGACQNKIYFTRGDMTIEVPEEANQSIRIDSKYSFVEGYEPNWPDETGSTGCKPNGFPQANQTGCE